MSLRGLTCRTGGLVDPEENEPIIDVGDIVFVNYVVTNHGDPLDLGSLLVAVSPPYDDWPYGEGMDSITDFELTEEMGVNRTAIAPGQMPDPVIYTLGSGESFSVGDNFHHQPGSPITFSARYTPSMTRATCSTRSASRARPPRPSSDPEAAATTDAARAHDARRLPGGGASPWAGAADRP